MSFAFCCHVALRDEDIPELPPASSWPMLPLLPQIIMGTGMFSTITIRIIGRMWKQASDK